MDDQIDYLREVQDFARYRIIVLDACRFDIVSQFLEECPDDFRLAAVDEVESPATFTKQWMKVAWPDEYDATYISAVPFISREDFKTDYNGSDHFEEVIDVWRWGHDKSIGTVPPEIVRDAALDHDEADKLIVHFVQPHAPYIGDPQLLYNDVGAGDMEELGRTVDDETLREAYYGNFVRVWMFGVVPLLERWKEGFVVITSDHGEALGENGYYGHNVDIPPVRRVPFIQSWQMFD